jgi:biotin synthase
MRKYFTSAALFDSGDMMRAALGTAIVMGLAEGKTGCPPTTAHFLVGNGCSFTCGYCGVRDSRLARIDWLEFPDDRIFNSPFNGFRRVCLQLTSGSIDEAIGLIPRFRLPVSVSLRTSDKRDIERIFAAGAERVCLPLDACSEKTGRASGRPDFDETLKLLKDASQEYPGRISTHLIIGLGETEKEAIDLLQKMHVHGIRVGLFAFTPVKGTALESRPRPYIGAYRRIQIAKYLVERDDYGIETGFRFNRRGQVVGLPEVADGTVFETSGCPGCNRPYFDSPAGRPYNFPNPPGSEEIKNANADAHIYEGTSIYKAEKLIKIRMEYSNVIKSISITGDFFVYPEDALQDIERALEGTALELGSLRNAIEKSIRGIDILGFDADSLVKAIMEAKA